MISSEVQRTLVKSPPELWAEVSDPESLARHLGEFGEIRITRVQPEQKVEWEADDASGTVVIKPSGWGTKVKLTVTREVSLDDDADTEPTNATPASEPAFEAPGVDVETNVDVETETKVDVETEVEVDVEATFEAEPQPVAEIGPSFDAGPAPEPAIEPAPRRGFFARLLGRRRQAPAKSRATTAPVGDEPIVDEALDDVASIESAPMPQTEPAPAIDAAPAIDRAAVAPTAHPQPEVQSEPGEQAAALAAEPDERVDEPQSSDIAAELAAAEELAAEQVVAVLTGVLDRLGAAHHRPFSRS